ncbi:MAG: hypothetical protein HY606_02430 [Planctomycetes bacterium]|nr:hypothetical protein [Planctomycetota bacterium]
MNGVEKKQDNFLQVLFVICGVCFLGMIVMWYFVSSLEDSLNNEISVHNTMTQDYEKIRRLSKKNPNVDKITKTDLKDTVQKYLPSQLSGLMQKTAGQPRTDSTNKWQEHSYSLSFSEEKNQVEKRELFDFLRSLYANAPDIKIKSLHFDFKGEFVTKFSSDMLQFQKIETGKPK